VFLKVVFGFLSEHSDKNFVQKSERVYCPRREPPPPIHPRHLLLVAIRQGSGGLFRKANQLARGAIVAAARSESTAVAAEPVLVGSEAGGTERPSG